MLWVRLIVTARHVPLSVGEASSHTYLPYLRRYMNCQEGSKFLINLGNAVRDQLLPAAVGDLTIYSCVHPPHTHTTSLNITVLTEASQPVSSTAHSQHSSSKQCQYFLYTTMMSDLKWQCSVLLIALASLTQLLQAVHMVHLEPVSGSLPPKEEIIQVQKLARGPTGGGPQGWTLDPVHCPVQHEAPHLLREHFQSYSCSMLPIFTLLFPWLLQLCSLGASSKTGCCIGVWFQRSL